MEKKKRYNTERERDKSGGEFVNYLHNNIKKDFWQTEGKRIIFYYYNLLRRVFIYLEDKWMISTWSLLNTISRYRLLSSDIHGGIIQWNYVLVSSFLFFFARHNHGITYWLFNVIIIIIIMRYNINYDFLISLRLRFTQTYLSEYGISYSLSLHLHWSKERERTVKRVKCLGRLTWHIHMHPMMYRPTKKLCTIF